MMLLDIQWDAVGASAAAFVAGAAGFWHKWGRSIWEQRKKRRNYDDVLENSRIFVQMGVLLRSWRASTGAQRVLLLYARNSGSPWPVEKPVKTSCLMQSTAEGVENTWHRWQDWEVDPAYRELLSDVLHAMSGERGVAIYTDQMADGVLRDSYRENEVAASVLFGLFWRHQDSALIYVSLNFKTREEAAELVGRPERLRRKRADALAVWRQK